MKRQQTALLAGRAGYPDALGSSGSFGRQRRALGTASEARVPSETRAPDPHIPNSRLEGSMLRVQCSNCGLQLQAVGAPSECPRCVNRGQGRFEMVPTSIFDLPPSLRASAIARPGPERPPADRLSSLRATSDSEGRRKSEAP